MHLRGLVREWRAAETQQGLIDALLLTELVAELIPDPFLQNAQTPLTLHFVLDRETKTNDMFIRTVMLQTIVHFWMCTILPSIFVTHELFAMQPKVSNSSIQRVTWSLMLNYLQIKAVEEFEKVRDSLEVQKLSSQKKSAHHHVHVFFCKGKKLNSGFWQTSTESISLITC